MPKATPDANKSDNPPSIGKPTGGGGGGKSLLFWPGVGGVSAYTTILKSIKLKHNIIILIFFLFIFGVEYVANLIKL